MSKSLFAAFGFAALACVGLPGCGGGGAAPLSPGFAVGGTISGPSGVAVLQDNGGDDLAVSVDGSFTFATPLAATLRSIRSGRRPPSGRR